MKMRKNLMDLAVNKLASDVTLLAPAANPVKVSLIVANFNPNVASVLGDLTLGTGTGLVAIPGVVGAQLESVDPLTGENIIEIKQPAGGFRWETPVDFVGTVVVYGYAITDNGVTSLYAAYKLDVNVELNGPNQAVTAPPLQIRLDRSQVR